MKLLTATRTLTIPEGVTVEIKGRKVRVKARFRLRCPLQLRIG
jgi:ribosomal protein L6P/L9E